MTKQLILMRHAKSNWDNPLLEDHARSLNARGHRSAMALGSWLRAQGYVPDHVYSSSATRTRETCAGLGLTSDATFLDRLYHAGPEQMLQTLRDAKGDCILMLGHNPGIAWLASELVAAPPQHPRFQDYPTCATLIVDFPITRWRDCKIGTGHVRNFITPRDLTA